MANSKAEEAMQDLSAKRNKRIRLLAHRRHQPDAKKVGSTECKSGNNPHGRR